MIPKNENILKVYDLEVSWDSLNNISQILIWRIYWGFQIFYVNSSNYARTIPSQQCFFMDVVGMLCGWFIMDRGRYHHIENWCFLRFQEFLWQLLIDLDLVHRLVISDLLSWFIKPCRNHSKVSTVFFDVCRWYALRLIHNGSREIPPCWFCFVADRNGLRTKNGSNKWKHIESFWFWGFRGFPGSYS